MSNPVDMWSWLNDADTQVGDDGPGIHNLFQQLTDASRAQDTEGVRTARLEFERLAATHDLPWLGVFGRHWDAQYRLNFRNEGATAVADVVAAFELAHRAETVDCPQSICSVQDLAIVYGNVDGPGYANETLAATKDAMSRIDSSWPCWDCLSLESIDGLHHAGQHLEAVEFLIETEVELRSTGATPSTGYARRRLQELLDAGKDDEALAFDEALVRDRYNTHSGDDWPLYELHRARALLRHGQTDAALAILEESANPVDWPRFALPWMTLVTELMAAGAIENNDHYSATTVRIAQHLRSGGAWRRAFDTGIEAALAAANRGAIGSAQRSRELCVDVMDKLVKPLDAPAKLAAVDAAIAGAPDVVSDEAPIDQLVAQLEDQLSTQFDEQAFTRLAELLRAQGWAQLAQTKLWRYLAEHPGNEECAMTLMSHLMGPDGGSGADRLLELAELIEEKQPANALWARANRHARLSEWDECGQACAAIVAIDPGVVNTRRLWTHAMRSAGNHPGAAELSGKILEMTDPLVDEPQLPPSEDDETSEAAAELAEVFNRRMADLWMAILNGTLGESWPLVRAAAAELSIELTGDSGKVEEEWEHCFISFTDDDGVQRSQEAQRTGPVTARIVQIALPGRAQRFGDRVVFEPAPLNAPPPDATDEQRTNWVFEYPTIATVDTSNVTSFAIEGVVPDDEDSSGWLDLRAGLFDAGFGVWSYSVGNDFFRATAEMRAVLLLAVATDSDSDLSELNNLLESLTEDWPHPLAWPALVEAAGGDKAEHDKRLANMWGEDD